MPRTRLVAASIGALILLGCGTAPSRPPEEALGAAARAIEAASERGAGQYGARYLETARRELDSAREAASQGDAAALHSAEKARLNAELAAVQADIGRFRRERTSAEKRISRLRAELELLR